MILSDFGGEFPRDYTALRSLPGIGDYTAGAICSICFDLPTPAVDGNVLRVISRLTDDPTPIDLPARKKAVQAALAAVYPEAAGDFTQALMELGATLCGPNRRPDCPRCPCRELCLAHSRGTAESLPVKSPKRERKQENRTVFILSCDGRYGLRKREDTGLLAGLWEFPNISGALEPEKALDTLKNWQLHPRELTRKLERKHIFTHIRWDMTGYYIEVTEPAGGLTWLTVEEIEATSALPTAFRQFWEEIIHV